MKSKFKKNQKNFLLTLSLGLMGSLILAACSSQSNELSEKLLKAIKTDSSASDLKTELAGYSKDDMEIVANKQEIATQSDQFIKAFNEFYGTKLRITQVGGTTDFGQFVTTKFANGVGSVLLLGTGSTAGYSNIIQHFISTPASKMLKNDNTTQGEISIDNKKFMPAAVESLGVIYNREVFKKAKIVVYEGKSFETATDKPSELVKSNSTTTTVNKKEDKPKEETTENNDYDGVIEFNNSFYVFTSDLKTKGYEKIVSQLEKEKINPFYITSKTAAGNIWPITNHLLGGVVSAVTGLKSSDETKLKTMPDQVLTEDVMKAMKEALGIYGHSKSYNTATNTVDLAMSNVALGTFAMTQNGTWSVPQIQRAKKDANVGFLPMPAFNKTDKTAMLFRTISQRWGLTTLGNDQAKAKTAKLFLQFLYQTKSGLEYGANEMQIYSPFKPIPNVNIEVNDPLWKSGLNYTNSDVGETVDNYFVNGFNNSDQVLREVTNEGFSNPAGDKTKLVAEFTRLVNAAKK